MIFLGLSLIAGIDAVAADPGALGCEHDEPVSDAGQAQKSCGGFGAAETAALATAGESVGILGLRQVIESDVARSSLIHESSLARSCADVGVSSAGLSVSVSAALCVAALPAGRSLTYAQVAANACGEVASAGNSGRLDTFNMLKVQQLTSCNFQGVVAPNSRRKVRRSCPVGNRFAELTVDMSPAPAAGTYRRSAGTVHVQRQVSRKRLARSSGVGVGPGPGPGGRSGLVGGVSGFAAACLGIPCSLVVPPGRHSIAPQSLGWARVCGTEDSGGWVLKGDARTNSLPEELRRCGGRLGTKVRI